MAKKNDIVRDVVALAGEFVIKRKGEWDHETWETFLKKAGKAGADTSEGGQVLLGKLLETVKKLYVTLQEPAPVKAEKKPKSEKPAKAPKAPKAAGDAPAKPAKKKAAKATSEG